MYKNYFLFFLFFNDYSSENGPHRDPFWYQSIQTVGISQNRLPKGILKIFIPHRYPLWSFAPQKGARISIALLDQQINDDKKDLNHSSLMEFLIKTIAPYATCSLIPILSKDGRGDRMSFIEGLIKAIEKKISIVNISLKIEDLNDSESLYTKTIETLLSYIPYSIAASGNDALLYKENPVEAFPAHSNLITCDIGSFGYNVFEQKYSLSYFSQYAPKYGPRFVMPGELLTDYYINGTSGSTALFSAFIALILGEFSTFFTKREILLTCYASSYHLGNSTEWRTKSLLGTVDTRLTFFLLHSIQKLKGYSLSLYYAIENNFELFLFCIKHLLFNAYEINTSTFLKKYEKHQFLEYLFYNKSFQLIEYVSQVIAYCFDAKLIDPDHTAKIRIHFPDFTLNTIKVLLKERNNISILECFDDMQKQRLENSFKSCLPLPQNSIHFMGKTLMDRLKNTLPKRVIINA